jgi:hypothetical protein
MRTMLRHYERKTTQFCSYWLSLTSVSSQNQMFIGDVDLIDARLARFHP